MRFKQHIFLFSKDKGSCIQLESKEQYAIGKRVERWNNNGKERFISQMSLSRTLDCKCTTGQQQSHLYWNCFRTFNLKIKS